jgi:hypothetical protein
MITGELKSQIDKVWEAFWTGGLSNPLTVIEQMNYLLFIRRLDELQTAKEQKANLLKKPIEEPIYDDSNQELRWSRFKNMDPEVMHKLFTKQDGVFDYLKNVGSKSEKGKNKSWITMQNQAIQTTIEPARKFCNQLDNLFLKEQFDATFLNERVQAAYQYFFKILDGVLTSNLKKIAELSRVKKTKQYAEELEELDELLTETILKIKKARLLIEAVATG